MVFFQYVEWQGIRLHPVFLGLKKTHRLERSYLKPYLASLDIPLNRHTTVSSGISVVVVYADGAAIGHIDTEEDDFG